MKTTLRTSALVAALFLAAIPFAHGEDKTKSTGPTLDTIKKLAGDWVTLDKDGKPTEQVASSMRVTAAGSAVLEVLFPGTPHEMVTLYHMEGNDLILTHYCALGNQPRMKAEHGTNGNKIVFKFDGGSNIKADKDSHMHEGTIIIVDENRMKSEWTRCEAGKACETHAFEMVRKKK